SIRSHSLPAIRSSVGSSTTNSSDSCKFKGCSPRGGNQRAATTVRHVSRSKGSAETWALENRVAKDGNAASDRAKDARRRIDGTARRHRPASPRSTQFQQAPPIE